MFLYQQLWLLALDEKKGSLKRPHLYHALTAAVLFDLVLQHHLKLNERRQVIVQPAASSPDPILANALAAIRAEEKPDLVRHYLLKLAYTGEMWLTEAIARGLQQQGMLEISEKASLGGLIKQQVFQLKDPAARQTQVDLLRQVVFEKKNETLHNTCLVVLTGQTDSARICQTPQERLVYRRRLEELLKKIDHLENVDQRNFIVQVLKTIEAQRSGAV